MVSQKDVLNELEDLGALKELVETYEEIAISRMRKIRNSVLATRDFTIGLAQVFGEVSGSYKEAIEKLMMRKKKSKEIMKAIQNPSILPHNGKTVSVFLSSNTGLYGEIIQKTFQVFLEHIQKHPEEEVVVIGRFGVRLLKDPDYKKPFTEYDLSDGVPEREALHDILEKLIQYSKILVFYGLFQSVVTQKPEELDLYGAEVPVAGGSHEPVKYLFEPSLENILEFFEKEILAAIFEQTIAESNLAKYASRMVSLDSATDNIRNRIKDVQFQGYLAKHRDMNRKQLNTLTGFSLWKIR